MKKEVQGIFQGAIDTLHKKIFWKIQGLNLLMIMKKIAYYILSTMSLIYVVSVALQEVHLSNLQRGNILNGITIFVVVVILFNAVKNIVRGSDSIIEFSKALMNSFFVTLMFYLAFTIHLTSYEKISNLIIRWFLVVFLLKIVEIMEFRKLSKQIESGKKPNYFSLVEQQVTKKFEDERLSEAIVSESYKLKYSRIIFKVNRRTLIENRVINLERDSVGTTGKGENC